MSIDTSPLSNEELSLLAWLAAEGRRALGLDKQPVEHRVDDILWDAGWVVMARVPPDERNHQ